MSSQLSKQKKRVEILDFAHKHRLVVNPAGYDYYIDLFFKCNSCPCDQSRLNCPCPEAIEEVEKDGWCKCRLFWCDYKTFRENHLNDKGEGV